MSKPKPAAVKKPRTKAAPGGSAYGAAEQVALEAIHSGLEPAASMRVGLTAEAVEEYAGHLDEMPPVLLVRDKAIGTLWVADGAHTICAARRAGRSTVLARVKAGDFEVAWRDGGGANRSHGVRVTNADKVHRVKAALGHPEWKDWSDAMLAEHCGVTRPLVEDVRKSLFPPNDPSEHEAASCSNKRLGKDGKLRTAKPKKGPLSKGRRPNQAAASSAVPGAANGDGAAHDPTRPLPIDPAQYADGDKPPLTPEKGERAGRKWTEKVQAMQEEMLRLMNSMPRRGGVVVLTHPWPERFRTSLITILKDVCRDAQEWIHQLEGAQHDGARIEDESGAPLA